MLPDESFPSYFLDVFAGRSASAMRMRTRVGGEPGAGAAPVELQEIHDKLTAPAPAAQFVNNKRSDEDNVASCSCGVRPAALAAQMDVAIANIQANAKNRQFAYENILWALNQHEGIRDVQ